MPERSTPSLERLERLQRHLSICADVDTAPHEHVISVELVPAPDGEEADVLLSRTPFLARIRERHDTWCVYVLTLCEEQVTDRHQLHAFYGPDSWDAAISYAHSEAEKRGITCITCNGVKHE